MKKVQNAAKKDSALDELYKRYDHRTTAFDRSPEAAQQKTREIETRTVAPKSYKVSAKNSENLKKYKNGLAGSRKYMTDGDFANYYKATREYTPDSNVELDTTVLLQRIDRARYKNINNKKEKNDVRSKLVAEANRVNPKNVNSQKEVKKAVKKVDDKKPKRSPSKIKDAAAKAARTWIPLEERHTERTVEGGKTKLPVSVILAIFVVCFALLLIVGSAVLLGSASSELNDLKDQIEDIDAQINEAQTDLDKKNDEADVETFAKEELGMIEQEHVKTEYINSDKTDEVQKNEEKKPTLTSLIDWIFQLFR